MPTILNRKADLLLIGLLFRVAIITRVLVLVPLPEKCGRFA